MCSLYHVLAVAPPPTGVTRMQSPATALMLLWKRGKANCRLDTCTRFPFEDTEQTSQRESDNDHHGVKTTFDA